MKKVLVKLCGLESLRAGTVRTATLLLIMSALAAAFAKGGGPPLGRPHNCKTQDPPAPSEVRVLAPGDRVKVPMDAGATHTYKLPLAAQHFAQVVVEQKGVDVEVKVFAPDNSLLNSMDSPIGFYGRETVSILAEAAGDYRIEISSAKRFPPGDYELIAGEPRPSSAFDQQRVTAERLFTEAQKLRMSAKYEAAIGKYNEALNIWRELGELRGQGYSLSGIGRSYKALRQLAPALDHLGQALSRLREANDISGQAFVLNETGAAHRDLGALRDAFPNYEAALTLRLTLNDRYGLAQLYNNIGLTSSYIGYQPNAAENYDKALMIWRELGMHGDEMNTLINAAKARVEMGDLDVAHSQYQTVLSYCDTELSNEHSPLKEIAIRLKPSALNGLGLVNDTWADANSAFHYYKQALELFRANKNYVGEADVLDNTGMVHAFLGDASQALEYFRQALVLRERLNQPNGWGLTLSNMGYAYTLLGDNQEALRQLTLALSLSRRSGDKRFEAYSLIRTGMAHVALNEPVKALENYEKALAIQQEPAFADPRGQALTLDKMGEALALLGGLTQARDKYEQALEKYGQAIERWKSVGDGQGEALSLYGIAAVERERHNLANARDRAEQAINIVEKLRNRVTARQLQMTYFAGKQDLYALAIDIRMQLYELSKSQADIEAALSISERARARNLLDLLSETRAELFKAMSPEDAEKNARLEQQISHLTQALLRLRGVGAKHDASMVERTLATYIKEQDELLDAARRASRNQSIASQVSPLTPAQIQQLLDEKTLLLQYSLGKERSHLWAVTRTGIDHHFLKSRAEIEATANQLRAALTAYEPQKPGESNAKYLTRWSRAPEQYRTNALALSRMILEPVSTQLGDKRLVIVADGALQYIPFEVLPRPESHPTDVPSTHRPQLPVPLLSRNDVVYQPSASTLALLRGARRRSATKLVAVFADPVFDQSDQRIPAGARAPDSAPQPHAFKEKLSRSLRDIGDTGDWDLPLTKLDYSLTEANAITALAPRGSWMKAVGFRANRALAMSPTLKQFSIVHFATHGIINDKHPELSGIVLSMVNDRGQPEDGYLTLRDIYNLDLPVRLVVVSACRTGVGKSVRGEGLIGLTRGFMYAGAQSLVVSLWRVDDHATAELMKRFYTHMLGKNKLPPAAALRRAKLDMVEGHERWRAPYFWAGFVLQGDWK